MNVRDYAAAMAAYNRWMNEKVYDAAAGLADAERKRDLGAAFRSVHGTLNHLLLTDGAWLQRFRGEAVTMKAPDQELYSDFTALREARSAADAEICAWAEAVTEEYVAAEHRFFSVSNKREYVLPGWAAVAHFFNHQAHHRGQVTTLLSQLGADAGVTDLPAMPCFHRD